MENIDNNTNTNTNTNSSTNNNYNYQEDFCFDQIESAIEDISRGKMIIVVDDEKRENEGDFVMAAEKVTAEDINFMATNGRGIICAPITKARAKELELDYMVKEQNTSAFGTPFTVTIDYLHGTTTGISCPDRAKTITSLTNKNTSSKDLLRPGHVFPLIARDGGVLEREGHTEAAVDLAMLAGLYPAGAICEILKDDGLMARTADLIKIAKKFNLKIITIKDLILYKKKQEEITNLNIRRSSVVPFPTKYGDFLLHMFECTDLAHQGEYHVALSIGLESESKSESHKNKKILVRIHSECFTGDIFGSKRCDCGEQLMTSLKMISDHGKGALLYLKQEGRGIGAINKIKAYELQDQGMDTVTANHQLGLATDLRDYSIAANILKYFKITSVDLITNNPDKVEGLIKGGIVVENRISLEIAPNNVNIKYLTTKRDKMGHLILDDNNYLH
ncbi:MAG: 3,4-dihydroxy-2-butanone-4-phosphate synthase [Oligoflexia bacterium]|nr:3,4-dihydroxy-2-butanone-4-phosphate synthase [Oligoflexia bacterium]